MKKQISIVAATLVAMSFVGCSTKLQEVKITRTVDCNKYLVSVNDKSDSSFYKKWEAARFSNIDLLKHNELKYSTKESYEQCKAKIIAESEMFFNKALENKEPKALRKKADMLKTAEKYKESIELYEEIFNLYNNDLEKFAKEFNTRSLMFLAQEYYLGISVKKDLKKAEKYVLAVINHYKTAIYYGNKPEVEMLLMNIQNELKKGGN